MMFVVAVIDGDDDGSGRNKISILQKIFIKRFILLVSSVRCSSIGGNNIVQEFERLKFGQGVQIQIYLTSLRLIYF